MWPFESHFPSLGFRPWPVQWIDSIGSGFSKFSRSVIFSQPHIIWFIVNCYFLLKFKHVSFTNTFYIAIKNREQIRCPPRRLENLIYKHSERKAIIVQSDSVGCEMVALMGWVLCAEPLPTEFNSQGNSVAGGLLLSPFCRWRNWATERLIHLPQSQCVP